LERKDLYDYYLKFISSRTFTPGEGYRIFRIIDPLEEFVKANKDRNTHAITRANELLSQCKAYILEKFLCRIKGINYFTANPEEQKFKNPVIRAESYYIVKHMRDYAPRMFDSHMLALENFIIKDGMAYNEAYLGDDNVVVADKSIRFPKNIKSSDDKFYPYALDQVLMIDLFSDWFMATGNGHKTLKSLSDNYSAAINAANSGEIMDVSPEYLFAAQRINNTNNLPYSLYAMTINSKPQLASSTERRKSIINLLNLMNTKYSILRKDGVISCCRIEPEQVPAYMIMSDYYALKSISNYVNNKD
jgi:hypothetical protein